ncbi:MAG: HAD family phosphatase [Kocuria sp.]|nr:HAD family phosphatase [Kocuria sp.]
MASGDTHSKQRDNDNPRDPVFPDAVLWDMDGTLVDTEEYWFAAEAGLMADHGIAWSQRDSLEMVGTSEKQMISTMRSRGLPLSGDQIVAELNNRVIEGATHHVSLFPGVLELLLDCHTQGIPTALVTNSRRRLASVVQHHLDTFARQRGWDGGRLFDVAVTSDLGLEPKPSPAPYTFAARRLAALHIQRSEQPLDVRRMVAFEDSLPGVRSAVTAGIYTVGVANRAPLEDSEAHVVVKSVDGLTLEGLGELVRATHHAPEGRTTP